MAILVALLIGLIAGWAFARGRTDRIAHGAVGGILAAGGAAVVAAIAGDDPVAGVALGLAAGAFVARMHLPGTIGQLPPADPRRRTVWFHPLAILAALLLLRIGVATAGSLPLTADEAQYWDWAHTPDLAYYSKPGGIAWLLSAWCAVAGDTLVALRCLGLLLAVAAIGLAWPIAGRATGDRGTARLATALAAVLPIHACTAGLVTTDVPLALCWAGFLFVLLRTPAAGGTPAWWHAPTLGILLAAGLNAKYAMFYAPLAVLAAAPALAQVRAWLRTPAPWVALAIALLGLLPMLVWNAGHGWVGFLHVASQGGAGREFAVRPVRMAEFLGGQLLVGMPVSLLLPVAAHWAWRERARHPAAWLLAAAALAPLGVLLAVSLQGKVQPNWMAMSWLPAAILVAWYLNTAAPAWARRVAMAGAVLALLAAVLVAAAPGVRTGFPALPPSAPERKLAGWDELAAAVEDEIATRPERTVTLTAGYEVAAELAWHNRHRPRPYCANFGRRMNQYDLWGDLDATRTGWDAVLAIELDREEPIASDPLRHLPKGLRRDFAGVGTPRLVMVERGGRLWRVFLVVRLTGFDGTLDSADPARSW